MTAAVNLPGRRVRRFVPDRIGEAALLDAVRSIGRVPIRLRADVKRPD